MIFNLVNKMLYIIFMVKKKYILRKKVKLNKLKNLNLNSM